MAEIFIFRGFEKQDIDKGISLLVSRGENLEEMQFVRADQEMLGENVEELLNRIDRDGSAGQGNAAGSMAVIMAVNSQERALLVMRTFKELLTDPGEAAFAMITPTSLTWTLGYYMDHVSREHEYMKTHNPADDPDMKKLK